VASEPLTGSTDTREEAEPTEAVVEFSGHINAESAAALMADIAESISKGVQRVTLVLTTPGGNVDVGMRLYKDLRALPVDLSTHAFQLVGSMGIAVFLAGDARSMGPLAKLMLHPSSTDVLFGQRLTARQLREAADALDAGDHREREIIAERTGLTIEQATELNASGNVFLDAQEARDKGFVGEIKEFEMPAERVWFTKLGPFAEPESRTDSNPASSPAPAGPSSR
jgi:ATP-dependent protease ClpP protease subunit